MSEDTVTIEFTRSETRRLITALAESKHRTADRGYSIEADKIESLWRKVITENSRSRRESEKRSHWSHRR